MALIFPTRKHAWLRSRDFSYSQIPGSPVGTPGSIISVLFPKYEGKKGLQIMSLAAYASGTNFHRPTMMTVPYRDFLQILRYVLRACLHGVGGPQVGEVTRLGGVTRLSI